MPITTPARASKVLFSTTAIPTVTLTKDVMMILTFLKVFSFIAIRLKCKEYITYCMPCFTCGQVFLLYLIHDGKILNPIINPLLCHQEKVKQIGKLR